MNDRIKPSIQVIIQDAYKRTQFHFERLNQMKQSNMDALKKKQKQQKKPQVILIEDNKKPTPKCPTRINFDIQPLIQLRQDSTSGMSEEELIVQHAAIDVETIEQSQQALNKQRIEERKAQQKERFQFYESLNQEDKLAALDNQIDESFSYTYIIPSLKQQQIEITYNDFTKLNHYVNDTIINFFLRFLQHEVHDNSEVKIFSTYHTAKIVPYESIIHIHSHNDLAEEFGKNFQTILKWTKDDIFSCPYILFPLHLKEHWSLMIAYDPAGICRSIINQTQESGFFLYLDSLQILDERILFLLKIFLLSIYCRQTGLNVPQQKIVQQIKNSNIACYQPLITRQINYVDCGVHLLENAESFLSNPQQFIKSISGAKGWNKLNLFPRIMVLTKRLLIKRLLLNLVRYSKEQAVTIYNKERFNLFMEFKDKPTEYDYFDEDEFQEIYMEKVGQKQTLRLDFYLNENMNFYYQD